MILLPTPKRSGQVTKSAGASPTVLTLGSPEGWGFDGRITDDAAMKISAVYGCVTYLCDFVSSLPVYVWDGNKRERVTDHALNRVLSIRPNAWQTPSALKRFAMRSILLRGNNYAFVVRDPRTMEIKELIPLSPDCMRLELVKNVPQYFYTAPKTGELFRLDAQDVVHLPGDGEDGLKGLSVLRYAANTLSRASAADEYEQAVYKNNARPGGVLETDSDLGGLSSVPDPNNPDKMLSKKENVRRAWENAHAGSANAFRVAVLDNGLKYQPIKIDAYDASFVASKDVSVADIARFFGVPLHCLGAGKQSYSSNEQNSLEFVQGRGLAIVRGWEDELSYKLLTDSDLSKGYRIKFNLDGRLRGDTAARAAFYKSMHETGAYSVNDIMRLEDRPDVEGGDVHYASLNYVPLEDFKELSRKRNGLDKSMSTPG
ncbi:MAG: phage portal protein [Clostridiales bacterium]|nr:phage portal protein [Clostridiales bacterium]